MWYNSSCRDEQVNGAFCFLSAVTNHNIHCGQSAPYLVDSRPAVHLDNDGKPGRGRFVMSKQCTKCGSSGPFYKEKRARDGLTSQCKRCTDESNKAHYRQNKQSYIDRAKQWIKRNPEKERARKQRWNERNTGYHAHWRESNPDKVLAASQRRRAYEAQAEGSFTPSEWKLLCDQYDNRCANPACRKEGNLTVDHVIPLSRGGTNDISNIQPLCLACNSGKKDKTIDYRDKPNLERWMQLGLFGEDSND